MQHRVRRALGHGALAIALAVSVFFWVMADGDAGYAARVLMHQDSGITDVEWKRHTVVRPATMPRSWPEGGGCPIRESLPTGNAQSLIVVHDGRLVCEWHGNGGARDHQAAAFSVSKTVLSLLLARAVTHGQTGELDIPITHAIPELRARDERFTAVTMGHLLDMRSGIAFSEDISFPWVNRDYPSVYYAGDLAGTVVRRPRIEGPPGRFRYNDYAPNLIGLAVRRSTGTYLTQQPLQRLWNDLGAEHAAAWCVDDHGFPYHESGLVVTASDLARIGQLMLDDGRAAGRQVAPKAFLDRSLDAANLDPVTTFAGVSVGYRNGWWILPRGDGGRDLAAMGAHGQVMVVSPATRTVIVRMGDDDVNMTNIQIATTLQKLADRLA
ncbi:serine hydrolase domain-containing protein [Nonomuraea sp. NPDC049480]|uniref:serine hydrolase domain-containing protein n=1 Tax=Nonomuraea sp. NPDC049480 TaxID=3364353 RepID=UPI00379D168B